MRRLITLAVLLMVPWLVEADDPGFKLDLDTVTLEPPPEPPKPGPSHSAKKKARLDQWNDPMTRWMYQFNQQQAWIMRGTMPGGERVTGAVVGVKMQSGLPLHLVASSQIAAITLSEKPVEMVRWPWEDEKGPPVMDLDEQLSVLLGKRLDESK
jgi:hypothetical protein